MLTCFYPLCFRKVIILTTKMRPHIFPSESCNDTIFSQYGVGKVNLEIFLYDHDQIFITRIYLNTLDSFDMIQQQKQDIVQG